MKSEVRLLLVHSNRSYNGEWYSSSERRSHFLVIYFLLYSLLVILNLGIMILIYKLLTESTNFITEYLLMNKFISLHNVGFTEMKCTQYAKGSI